MGLAKDDTSLDKEIENMKPMERLRLIAGWYETRIEALIVQQAENKTDGDNYDK